MLYGLDVDITFFEGLRKKKINQDLGKKQKKELLREH